MLTIKTAKARVCGSHNDEVLTPPEFHFPAATSTEKEEKDMTGKRKEEEDMTGAIVGGVIGGLVLILVIVLGIWYYAKQKEKKSRRICPEDPLKLAPLN